MDFFQKTICFTFRFFVTYNILDVFFSFHIFSLSWISYLIRKICNFLYQYFCIILWYSFSHINVKLENFPTREYYSPQCCIILKIPVRSFKYSFFVQLFENKRASQVEVLFDALKCFLCDKSEESTMRNTQVSKTSSGIPQSK